jgi:hypothetical protein
MTPPGAPAYGPPPGGGFTPPPVYGAPGYAYPGYTNTSQGTNGMAIASMVLGILWVYWIGSILAIVFGFVALNQIKQRQQAGRGMAIAGLILGFIGLATLVLVIILVAVGGNNSTTFHFSTFNS